ncbi:MAG TPA: PIN domain-containing protein [Candidatus Limnocylindria bacterium]|nr:PIN domain-containing protein [Candidatus Limnocylindria bacterium]
MIFLDTNILLEITLSNRLHYTQVQRFLQTTKEETAISILTCHLVIHFGRKEKAEEAFLHAVLNENKLIALTSSDYKWATDNEHGKDFEDALQLSSAIRSGCSSFVTLDAALAKRYTKLPIRIVVPN